MGMRNIGDIEWLSYIAQPYISVITNCKTAHIGRLKSENEIFKAKTEILDYTTGYAILPNGNRFKNLSVNKIEKI